MTNKMRSYHQTLTFDELINQHLDPEIVLAIKRIQAIEEVLNSEEVIVKDKLQLLEQTSPDVGISLESALDIDADIKAEGVNAHFSKAKFKANFIKGRISLKGAVLLGILVCFVSVALNFILVAILLLN